MNRESLRWFVLLLSISLLQYWQGRVFISSLTPGGFADLEQAHTVQRIVELRSVWSGRDVRIHMFLEMVYLLALTGFLMEACRYAMFRTRWMAVGRIMDGTAFLIGVLYFIQLNCMVYCFHRIHRGLLGWIPFFYWAKYVLLAMVLAFLMVAIATTLRRKLSLVKPSVS